MSCADSVRSGSEIIFINLERLSIVLKFATKVRQSCRKQYASATFDRFTPVGK
jgi:hypothetical protein